MKNMNNTMRDIEPVEMEVLEDDSSNCNHCGLDGLCTTELKK